MSQSPISPVTSRKNSGFTLIELMIVVAIIGILAAIAYPSYKDSVYKARRADLKAEVLKIGTAQEKYFARHIQYARKLTDLEWAADPYVTDDGFYSIAVTNSPATGRATTYTLTATAQGDQVNDKCDGYTLSNLGKKTVSEGTNATCWDR